MKLPGVDRLGSLGFVGERKALALLFLGFYSTLFFLVGLSARSELPEYVPMMFGMMAIYVIAFGAVAAEWFWGRWFAVGLGYWGMWMTFLIFASTRQLPPQMVIFGSMHALIAVCLLGEKMAAAFDAKPEWRQRWKLDEQGVIRVKKSVTRAASALPMYVMWALAPRGDQSLAHTAALALAGVAVIGVGGLLAKRTWGLLVMTASGVAGLAAAVLIAPPVVNAQAASLLFGGLSPLVMLPQLVIGFAGVLLIAAAVPFVRPVRQYLLK